MDTGDKLQKLLNTKAAIKNALIEKGITNPGDKFSDYPNLIKSIQGSESGGSDINLSDATATADDILKGKTAYTASGKVEGTIETWDGSFEGNVASSGGDDIDLKITKNDNIKLLLAEKYVEEDVTISIDVKGNVNIPQTKIIFNDSLDVSQNFEYNCYFSVAGGWPVGSKLRCENGVLSIYNETNGWLDFYTSTGFVEAACQGAFLLGEYSAELMEWLIKNSKFGTEVLSEKVITENGNYEVVGYHKALVNVPTGLPKEFIEGTMVDIVLPEGITKIRTGMFYGYANLTEINIPNTVAEIGSHAFNGSGLISIVFPSNIKTIPASCCGACKKLTSVTIPNGVTLLDTGAFTQCSALTQIFIPKSVTKISTSCFSSCTNLATIDLSEHTRVPTLGSSALTSTLKKIKVKSSMVSQFKSATNWSTYADIITSS